MIRKLGVSRNSNFLTYIKRGNVYNTFVSISRMSTLIKYHRSALADFTIYIEAVKFGLILRVYIRYYHL